jgi:hypothetical protein
MAVGSVGGIAVVNKSKKTYALLVLLTSLCIFIIMMKNPNALMKNIIIKNETLYVNNLNACGFG